MSSDITSFKNTLQLVGKRSAAIAEQIPQTMKALSALNTEAHKGEALDPKIKELMALALAIAARCDGCICYHAQAAAKLKATKAEVAETIGVAITMGGGPSSVYGGMAMAAFEEFTTGN